MSEVGQTFFTSCGCMDGRVQKAANKYASLMFGAEFADTVTKAGLDGVFAKDVVDPDVYRSVKDMILVSVEKHHSFGIVVHGHEGCAGNPVDDAQHKKDIKRSIETIKKMVDGHNIEIRGVYISLTPRVKIEEVM